MHLRLIGMVCSLSLDASGFVNFLLVPATRRGLSSLNDFLEVVYVGFRAKYVRSPGLSKHLEQYKAFPSMLISGKRFSGKLQAARKLRERCSKSHVVP
jgi:hypothetical protein